MPESPLIVTGTTPDYVLKIHKKQYSWPVVFLMDSCFEENPDLALLKGCRLLFSNLNDFDKSYFDLRDYLSREGLFGPRFACFDCESLHVTSRLADYYKSPFPSSRAISMTRNKHLAGSVWKANGLIRPGIGLASSLADTMRLFEKFKGDVVLKPLSGSGSELLFHCREKSEIAESVEILMEQLKNRKDNPLYSTLTDPDTHMPVNPCEKWVVEEYVEGPEFSCDFILCDNRITVVRETGKLKERASTFGTVMCYTHPCGYPENFSGKSLKNCLLDASRLLGYDWGYFMADYIISDQGPVVIELTPRPGGDSIPDLVFASSGVDTLGIYLDFMMGGRDYLRHPVSPAKPCASINFFAEKEGTVEEIDWSAMSCRPEFIAFFARKKSGDRVALPPGDYDNRLTGYCIIHHEPDWDPEETAVSFQRLLKLSIT